jgi:hypothetical protein
MEEILNAEPGNPTDLPPLGPCCACGQSGPAVRYILMLHRLSPTPGKGWGCFQCGLPMNGAIAVICDPCLFAGAEIQFVCTGHPADPDRTPIRELPPGEFDHNPRLHPEIAKNTFRYTLS